MSFIVEKDWITATDLRAVAVIIDGEYRCGYVGVPSTHLCYGIGYFDSADFIKQSQVDHVTIGKKSPMLAVTAFCRSDAEGKVRRSLDILIDVHGGLTYSNGNGKYPVESDLWWFGFDCMHKGDRKIATDPRWLNHPDDIVRELPYIEAECESLSAQLQDIHL
jgi:hypothetical protein